MSERVDVLIVGGGPAGLAAGRAAAEGGLSTLIVHRDAEIGLPVRTSGGSWKSDIDRLGFPPSAYQAIDRVTFAGPNVAVNMSFAGDRCVVLDVPAAYKHLAGLAEKAGAEVRVRTRFERVARSGPDDVACEIARDGRRSEVSARYVVEASGVRRAVLTALGAAGRPARLGVGAEIEFAGADFDAGTAVLFAGSAFSPSGYGWIFPGPGRTARVGIGVLRPDSGAAPAPLLRRFLASAEGLERFGLKGGEVRERHFGVMPADGPAKRFVFGRIVAVGDSAGQALPTVGEGIRYCVDAGHAAGRAIVDAVRRPRRAESLLAAYAAWWDRRYRRRFELAQLIQERLGEFSDRDWDENIALLARMDEATARGLLRMDFSAADVARFLLRNPTVGLRAAARLVKRFGR